jgi:hypothetical protein
MSPSGVVVACCGRRLRFLVQRGEKSKTWADKEVDAKLREARGKSVVASGGPSGSGAATDLLLRMPLPKPDPAKKEVPARIAMEPQAPRKMLLKEVGRPAGEEG